MKRLLFAIVAMMLAASANAQTRNYYCEVKGIEKDLSAGLKIVFDFGNDAVYSAVGLKDKQKLVDENGEEIPFNSMVDAGNYMSEKGWTFLQAYTSVYGGHALVHWIFIKEASSPEEATEGIMTKAEYKEQKKKGNEEE